MQGDDPFYLKTAPSLKHFLAYNNEASRDTSGSNVDPRNINSWNQASLTINGVSFTNTYASSSSLPPKINSCWYVSYSGRYPWSHFVEESMFSEGCRSSKPPRLIQAISRIW